MSITSRAGVAEGAAKADTVVSVAGELVAVASPSPPPSAASRRRRDAFGQSPTQRAHEHPRQTVSYERQRRSLAFLARGEDGGEAS